MTLASRVLPGVAGILVVLAAFQLFPQLGLVSQDTFPPVGDDLRALWDAMGEASFWTAVRDTLLGWSIGLSLAAAIGIPLGILIGSVPLVYRGLHTIIEFLRPIPSVALLPLAVLTFGTDLDSKLFLVVFASLWPILVQVTYGVQDVDPVATDTARSFGVSPWRRLVRVTLPSALPYAATGLRISSSVAIVLSITAELVIGAPGLGREITIAQESGAYALMYGLIIATGLLGWAATALLEGIEKRGLHWHTAYRPGVGNA